MNNDIQELLNELQALKERYADPGSLVEFKLDKFLENQRAIYGGAKGECAS